MYLLIHTYIHKVKIGIHGIDAYQIQSSNCPGIEIGLGGGT